MFIMTAEALYLSKGILSAQPMTNEPATNYKTSTSIPRPAVQEDVVAR